MTKRKLPEKLTVMDAVDNLSALAELGLPSSEEEAPSLAILEKEEHPILWDDPESVAENQERIKNTFRTIQTYLEDLYEKDKDRLKEPRTQRGIQAIMVLVGEAAEKVDKYTSLFKGKVPKTSITELKEYQELQFLYKNKISRKFTRNLSLEEPWEKEFATEEEAVGAEKKALRDLETVRRDRNYDLFYIRKEDGKPFFNRNLLRHVKLIGDFDESVSDPEGRDPLLHMRVLQDKDAHLSAKQILEQTASSMDEFFKEAMPHRGKPLMAALNKAVMALLLAANPRHLLSHTEGKSCLSYFADFQEYLRMALNSSVYQKSAAVPISSLDPLVQSAVHLCHMLCFSFFSHERDQKEELDLIYQLTEREKKKKEGKASPLSGWHSLLEHDEQMRQLLKRYPNGPLLKIFDAFREQEEKKGFDPLVQGNIPSQLYFISNEDLHISCLRLPCPTRQEIINKAEIAPEFKGFLRILNSRLSKQKHLLINLQDRTSSHEHARCKALEDLAKEEEFSACLTVVTLPKDTTFYLQNDTYRNVNEAEEFLAQFKEQIESGEQCGFYFPEELDGKKVISFAEKAFSLIHKVFFSSKKTLSRKNRLDFIEIFYQLLYMKLIEDVKPDSISFTCKDALDVGIAASAGFFAFYRLMSQAAAWKEEEKDFCLWLLYSPALLARERLIDAQLFHRLISFIETAAGEIDSDRKTVVSSCNSLYSKALFPKTKVEPILPKAA